MKGYISSAVGIVLIVVPSLALVAGVPDTYLLVGVLWLLIWIPLVKQQVGTSSEDSPRALIVVQRAFLTLTTCCFILAVDFSLFPRAFMKNDDYGVSVMDAGSGSFIFSMAASQIVFRQGMKRPGGSKSSRNSIIVLLTLGAARTAAIVTTNYYQIPKENGSHWNFFLTSGSTTAMTSVSRTDSCPSCQKTTPSRAPLR